MKKHKYLIILVLLILGGLIIYLTGVLELNTTKHYGDLGISKTGFYSINKDLLSKESSKIY